MDMLDAASRPRLRVRTASFLPFAATYFSAVLRTYACTLDAIRAELKR